jgi:hypothetical protein
MHGRAFSMYMDGGIVQALARNLEMDRHGSEAFILDERAVAALAAHD